MMWNVRILDGIKWDSFWDQSVIKWDSFWDSWEVEIWDQASTVGRKLKFGIKQVL